MDPIIFLGLSSVGIWIVFLGTSMFHVHRRQLIDPGINGLSELGSIEKTQRMFNSLLLFGGSVQLSFYLLMIDYLKPFNSLYGLVGTLSLLVTILAGIFCALLPTKTYSRQHHVIGGVGFVASPIGWLAMGVFIGERYPLAGAFFMVMGLVVSAFILRGFLKTKTTIPAVYESVFFVAILLTDIVFTLIRIG